MKSLAIALPTALVALTLPAARGAVLLSDTFDGSSFSTTNWTFDKTAGGGAAAVSGGTVSLNSGFNSTSQRTALASNVSNINPFTSPLTISLSGLSLTSASTTATSIGFIVIGRNEVDTTATIPTTNATTSTVVRNYNPVSGAPYDDAGSLSLNLFRTNSTGTYQLRIYDQTDSLSPFVAWNLSGMPTDLTWVVDGATKSYSFNLQGASIIAGGSSANGVGTGTGTGTWTRFDASDLVVGGGSISRVVIGTVNSGALDTGATSVFSIGDLVVSDATSAIPEPSSFALLASALAGGLAIVRRRRR